MKRTGIANLPLHYGKCPKWLFERMVKLSEAISEAIILEYSQDEFLRRLSDPNWFQAFGCVLGFDFHSSGLTTTVLGAMKTSIKPTELGIAVLGGKGKASRKTQREVECLGDVFSLSSKKLVELKYSSRMAAKVDSTCIQAGYNLYQHNFLVSEGGKWVVIQQGLNPNNRYARRYHWMSDNVSSFVQEPHSGIISDSVEKHVLNMTSKDSEDARKQSVDLINDDPKMLRKYISGQSNLLDFTGQKPKVLNMQMSHFITNMNKKNLETLQKAHEIHPSNYEELLSIQGIGPKTVRSLALISEIIYGASPSWEDPVKFSFCVGGKDKIPYVISKSHYSENIEILQTALRNAKLGDTEKLKALKRLNGLL